MPDIDLPSPSTAQAGLASLLAFEAEMRRYASVNELCYFLANETKRILPFDQLFVLKRNATSVGFHVLAASGLAVVDRNAPFIQAMENVLKDEGTAFDPSVAQGFDARNRLDQATAKEYPFLAWHWQPLKDRNAQGFAGLLIARTVPLDEGEVARVARVAETSAHAWLALTGDKPVRRLPKLTGSRRRWLAVAAAVIAFFPVRLSALAPVEVVAEHPFVISAPYAGVISQIHVVPNAKVSANQPLLAFEDVKVRNEMRQAMEKLQVAKSKIDRSTSAAFGNAEDARDVATARAEYSVALTEYQYARDIMAKSQILAPVAGMAIYSDRRDWEGRAVNVGDPIMQIADPHNVTFLVDLPSKEQMSITQGSEIKVWLDASPLSAIAGKVEQASYQARQTADGVLAFAVSAKPVGNPPRIGSRGTAKIYGEWVPLIYSVLRRPLASARQFIGL